MVARNPKHCSNHWYAKCQGFGTLEVVIIIAVLLSVALVFRSALTHYAQRLINTVFNEEVVIDDLSIDQTENQ